MSNRVFDADGMLQRLKGDSDHLVDLIVLYQRHSPRLMENVRAALDSGDREALASAAHALKGATSHVHASAVHEAASKLERLGHAGGLVESNIVFQELEREWATLRETLADYCASCAVESA